MNGTQFDLHNAGEFAFAVTVVEDSSPATAADAMSYVRLLSATPAYYKSLLEIERFYVFENSNLIAGD